MDALLPIWSRPHRFWRIGVSDDESPAELVEVFTFGLALTDLADLHAPAGVAAFGRRWGFEWLLEISARLRQEEGIEGEASLVGALDRIGVAGPNHRTFEYARGEPLRVTIPEAIVAEYAEIDGARIRAWSVNAFGGVNHMARGIAAKRERVPRGYANSARQLLEEVEMKHAIEAVQARQGGLQWAHRYGDLVERLALELEDLTVRRPSLRLCRLCRRPFVPSDRGQSICAGQLWATTSRQLIEHCAPQSETANFEAAAQAEYRKRRKTAHAQLRRAIKRFGGEETVGGVKAVARYEQWREENPSPAPRGRRPRSFAMPEPPSQPNADNRG